MKMNMAPILKKRSQKQLLPNLIDQIEDGMMTTHSTFRPLCIKAWMRALTEDTVDADMLEYFKYGIIIIYRMIVHHQRTSIYERSMAEHGKHPDRRN